MFKKFLSSLVSALAIYALVALAAGSASAATLEQGASSFRAIYGFPPGSATEPIGGGVGRNFGFGENMLFQADTGVTGKNLNITIEAKVAESADAYLGGTLMSNTTGAELPLSFEVQFADLQHNTVSSVASPAFTDTADRHWIAEICSSSAACKVDPRLAGKAFQVEIQDVSFDIGPGEVVQGTVWGEWVNGTAEKAACIKLTLPPELLKVDTLIETQGPKPGEAITAISGEACLVSANNDYYPGKTPAVVIK